MQKRVVRLTLLALLLAIGTGAGTVAWNISGQLRALDQTQRDLSEQLDRVVTAVNDIAAAQHVYVAPGQPVQPAVKQASALIQRLYSDLETIRPALRSAEAAELLAMASDAAARLAEADGSARGYLETEQQLWAAEVIFGQARNAIATITQGIRELQAAESRAAGMEQAALSQTLWMVIGGAALLWLIGLIALARVPRAADATASGLTLRDSTADTAPVEGAPTPMAVDLTATAGVCIALSRLTSADALPDLLARAAGVIDASGIIIWMGAGEELFPAAFHGYDPRTIARLGPIARSADNATAASWRTGEVRFVQGDMMSNGAIVAPMFGADSCIGVLAAEVRHGREADPAVHAVTGMIAAQLATVVSAWPAPSTSSSGPAADAAPLREASGT